MRRTTRMMLMNNRKERSDWEDSRYYPQERKIGYSINPQYDPYNYEPRMGGAYSFDVKGHMAKEPRMGGAAAYGGEKLTRPVAEKWVAGMKACDGSAGQHWSFDQTEQMMKQSHVEADPVEFYVVMNMLYSDYCMVAKRFNLSNDFYIELTKAFLMDPDAADNKVMRYYQAMKG